MILKNPEKTYPLKTSPKDPFPKGPKKENTGTQIKEAQKQKKKLVVGLDKKNSEGSTSCPKHKSIEPDEQL